MSCENLLMKISQRIKSVRFILTLWYSVVLLAAFTLFGYGVFVYLKHLQEGALQRNLMEEVDWIGSMVDLEIHRYPDKPSLDTLSADIETRIVDHFVMDPRNYIVMLTSGPGNIVFQTQNLGDQTLLNGSIPSDRTIVQSLPAEGGGSICVAARRVNPFTIQIAYSEGVTEVVLQHLLSIFAVMVPAVLFLSVAGGWFLAGIILRPIAQISSLAQRITAENLDERIPPRPTQDEIGDLINTINGMITRLQSSFRQMQEFLVNVAHELKTPLTILKGESELALSKPLPPADAKRLVSSYLEETIRLSRIVEDLLMLAKAEAGQLSLSHEQVAVHDLVHDLFEDAQILSATKQLSVELERNESALVWGDTGRLRQLLRSIVSNAVQYTDPPGTIKISSQVTPPFVVVEVKDTGIGIAPEDQTKIFQRFYRGEEARSRSKGGSGLGLAIAKWIVEAHGGSIEVQSTPGKGSCFTLRLPCISREAEPQRS